MRTRGVLAGLVATLTLVAGCARPGSTSWGGAAINGDAAGLSCEDNPAQAVPAPLPAGFVPVAVTRCQFTVKAFPGEGEWTVRIDQRAEGALDDLVRAVQQKSEPQGRGLCDLVRHPVFVGAPAALQICRYALSAETIRAETTEFRIGTLVSAPILEGQALTQFLAAASAAPPVGGACDKPQSEFAVLSPRGGRQWVYVETAGC